MVLWLSGTSEPLVWRLKLVGNIAFQLDCCVMAVGQAISAVLLALLEVWNGERGGQQ